ncbi:MAG TPA: hypothetical protein VL101_16795, partial [Nordella sp.]|nr:hypothetical protein [Nordella sp.]
MRAAEAAAAIEWLVEMGADEIIGSEPVNRLVAPPPAPSPAQQAARPTSPSLARSSPLVRPAVPARDMRAAAQPAAGNSDAAALAAQCATLADIEQALMRF